MNIYGWTTWGWCDLGTQNVDQDDLGRGRLYKHHTGLVVAVPEDYEGDVFLALAQMNEHLEAAANIPKRQGRAER